MVNDFEEPEIMGSDVHYAFIQVKIPEAEEKERFCMKIMVQLVDWIVDISTVEIRK